MVGILGVEPRLAKPTRLQRARLTASVNAHEGPLPSNALRKGMSRH